MTRSIRTPLLAAMIAIGSIGTVGMTAAHAEGLYVGGNVAVPDYRSPINGISGDNKNVGVNVYGGYQLTPNFALEAGFFTLGHLNGALGEAHAHGGYLDAVGMLPVGSSRFSVLGRVGYAQANVLTDAGNDNGGGLKFGAGVQYDLTQNVTLRAEVTRYRFDTFHSDTVNDQYSVGVKYAF